MGRNNTPLVPRDGHILHVLVVARISGCTNQKEVSLEDQEDHAKAVIAAMYDGPVELRVIATKGKGERLDRPELTELEMELRTGKWEVLVAEDIGRMIRGAQAVRLCGIAVDHGVRVLAPNDFIDTSDENWEEDVLDACKDHVGHNRHTSRRLKQKLMNRFVKFGGATAREIYGYLIPPGAKTYAEWSKNPTAEPVYQRWLKTLQDTLNCSAVADWLKELDVPTGKYARRESWDGKMVRRITRNPILKGLPGRGFKHTVKHHESGRRVAVTNPDGPQFKECPHLAFWTPEDFDDINARLDAKNKGCGRKAVHGKDPLLGVPRKRTRFPGQHARCWYCGRYFVWGGNGLKDNLMCSGSREWRCWNSIGFNGALAARKVVEATMEELNKLQNFEDQIRQMIQDVGQGNPAAVEGRRQKLLKGEAEYARKRKNLEAALKEYGPKPLIEENLVALEAEERSLAKERRELMGMKNRSLKLPKSAKDLGKLVRESFADLALDSPEFGTLLRSCVPEFFVYLVRLCDGGHLMCRAKVKLALTGVIPDASQVPDLEKCLTRYLTLDLFETQPQRERIRSESVRLTDDGYTQRELLKHLSETVALPTLQRSLALNRRMKDLSLESPYVPVLEPPQNYSKLRRHKNPKYHFETMTGYHPTDL